MDPSSARRSLRAIRFRPPLLHLVRTVILLMCLSAAIAGCTAWHRRDTALDPPATPGRVQVWAHGHNYDFHGVLLRADSVFGVPYWKPASCDSCRIAIARQDVDSIRVRETSYGRNAGLVVAGFAILIAAAFIELANMQ